jgi:hypothetical protein
MDPIAVDIRLIRALVAPELRISPGRALMARVVHAEPSGRGALSIAGTLIEAKLPKGVQAGQDLRLVVREVHPHRVVLGLTDPGAVLVTSPPVPLPGGGNVRVTEHEHGAPHSGGRGSHALTVRYDAPTLGPVDLHFDLNPASLRVTVSVAPGDPLDRARAGADALRQALGDNVDRPVSVAVSARREPLDLYA